MQLFSFPLIKFLRGALLLIIIYCTWYQISYFINNRNELSWFFAILENYVPYMADSISLLANIWEHWNSRISYNSGFWGEKNISSLSLYVKFIQIWKSFLPKHQSLKYVRRLLSFQSSLVLGNELQNKHLEF